jgi:hypothetical protein
MSMSWIFRSIRKLGAVATASPFPIACHASGTAGANTSLSIARDRVVGVLFELTMMWFIFDQMWGAPAIVKMKKAFTSGVRLVAQLVREPLAIDLKTELNRYFSLRETEQWRHKNDPRFHAAFIVRYLRGVMRTESKKASEKRKEA